MLRYTCRLRMYTASGEPVEALATAYCACCQVVTRGKYRLYTDPGLLDTGCTLGVAVLLSDFRGLALPTSSMFVVVPGRRWRVLDS